MTWHVGKMSTKRFLLPDVLEDNGIIGTVFLQAMRAVVITVVWSVSHNRELC